MKVLVIGGGGREHALAWKLAQSPKVHRVYCAPGNGGTAAASRHGLIENLVVVGMPALREWALGERIALTVVGPEVPLAAGVVDDFRAHGLRIFGPTRAAARLESSKAFSKAFMQRHGIPTAAHAVFTQAQAAHAHVEARGAPIVVKADGLAAGKGVVVAMTLEQAHAAIDAMLPAVVNDQQGEGAMTRIRGDGAEVPRVVLEDFLEGEEASFIVACDGTHVVPLATSQDHKRLLDGDQGPNTGGMGAYSPAPVVTPAVHARAMREVIMPTVRGMAKEGHPYSGFLYAGLMIDPRGAVKTLEFNCRLGDPEAQPILMRLKSDLFELLWAATEQQLGDVELQWDRRAALGVVVAAAGYPSQPVVGELLQGLPEEVSDAMVFHAGTSAGSDGLRTSGGRVLCVTALGETVKLAQQRAYEVLGGIHFDGMLYRKDIGFRALKG
jgi:phosphoribosylamine--glycine ligase